MENTLTVQLLDSEKEYRGGYRIAVIGSKGEVKIDRQQKSGMSIKAQAIRRAKNSNPEAVYVGADIPVSFRREDYDYAVSCRKLVADTLRADGYPVA